MFFISRDSHTFTIKFALKMALVIFVSLQTVAIAKVDPGSDAGTELVKKLGCDKAKALALGSASAGMVVWLDYATDINSPQYAAIDKDVAKGFAQRGYVNEAVSGLGDLLNFIGVIEEIAFGDPKLAFRKASDWGVDYSVALVASPGIAAAWGTMKTLSEFTANLNKELLSLNLDTFGDFVKRDPRLDGPRGGDIFLQEYLEWESNEKRVGLRDQVRIRRNALIDYANIVLQQSSFPRVLDWQKPKYRNQVRTAANRMMRDASAIHKIKLKQEELKKLVPELRAEINILEKFKYWWGLIKGLACQEDPANDPDKQRELAAVRYEFDVSLARLREALSQARGLSSLSSSLMNQLNTNSSSVEIASANAKKLAPLAQQCENEKAASTSTSLPRLSETLAAKVTELKNASNAVCDFGTPQSQGDAERILQDAKLAHERVSSLSNSSRDLLRQLAQAAASDSEATNGADSKLEAALNALEQETAFTKQRGSFAELQRTNGQMIELANSASDQYKKMRTKAAPWLAQDDIGAIIVQASRIVGTDREYIGASDTISEYRAIVSSNLSAAERLTKSIESDASLFAEMKQQGWDRYSNCKLNNVDNSNISSQITNTQDTIETQIWASNVCLQQAQQLVDPFGDIVTDSNEDDSKKDESTSGWGDGSMQDGSGSPTNNSGENGWGAGSMNQCVTPNDLQAKISSAIAQLQAAVSRADRYGEQIGAINNLVSAASHPQVCPEIKARVRATLADLKTANEQERAASREENLVAIGKGRVEQQRRRQSWARVASGLASTLQALQNANRSRPDNNTAGSTTSRRGSGSTTVSSGSPGPNAGNAECAALERQVNGEVGKWQQLARRRPTKDNAEQWCNDVVRWQTNFSNIMRRVEKARCASLPQSFLAQSRQISQTSCAS